MEVVDLSSKYMKDYLCCLEPWSDEMKDSGEGKKKWYPKAKKNGLRVKLALDEDGTPAGMIQYIPIKESFVQGDGLYFIKCIWVHGHKEGMGNRQGKGMGKALLEAAEEDARELGALGMAAWGVSLPFWMKASWFKKQGYKKADKDGMAVLLWKPFDDKAKPPKWVKRKKKPDKIPGKVTVDAFVRGWCPALNIAYERTKRAASEFGNNVRFSAYDTSKKEIHEEWGRTDVVYIDGKEVRAGWPPKYEKIRKLIEKRVKKL